jgi:ketosteroid isomerase-like protein
MFEESTTPDLVELTRRAIEAAGRRDFDAAMSFYTRDSAWDASLMGTGTFRGADLIRRELEQWMTPYEHFEIEVQEIRDMGCGVILAVQDMAGRLLASNSNVEMRFASVNEWRAGMITRVTTFLDIDEARAAAERLAQERE